MFDHNLAEALSHDFIGLNLQFMNKEIDEFDATIGPVSESASDPLQGPMKGIAAFHDILSNALHAINATTQKVKEIRDTLHQNSERILYVAGQLYDTIERAQDKLETEIEDDKNLDSPTANRLRQFIDSQYTLLETVKESIWMLGEQRTALDGFHSELSALSRQFHVSTKIATSLSSVHTDFHKNVINRKTAIDKLQIGMSCLDAAWTMAQKIHVEVEDCENDVRDVQHVSVPLPSI